MFANSALDWTVWEIARILMNACLTFNTLHLAIVFCATGIMFSDCVRMLSILIFYYPFQSVVNTLNVIDVHFFTLVMAIMDDIKLMCVLSLRDSYYSFK